MKVNTLALPTSAGMNIMERPNTYKGYARAP
jgi:hypothetical protein